MKERTFKDLGLDGDGNQEERDIHELEAEFNIDELFDVKNDEDIESQNKRKTDIIDKV